MRIYRRDGSPFWWIAIGRKTRKSSGTTDREQAKEFGKVLQERLWRRDKLGDSGALSWNEATERWLNESRKARTRDREILDWLKSADGPNIGEEMVSSVADPDALEELRKSALEEGWSHSTVDRMVRTVRAVLRSCKRWRKLGDLPHFPMYGEDDGEPRFLTPEQFARLRKELPPHLSRAARFAVLTLLRMRAQSQLTRDRVDLKAKNAWVPRAQMKGKSSAFGFPLSDDACKVVRECYAVDPDGTHVFMYDRKPVDNFNTKAFKKAAKAIGVPELRWHDLRHTGASWAVQNGVTLPELMVLGDWKSYRSVLRYARFAPSNAVNAAKRVASKMRSRR